MAARAMKMATRVPPRKGTSQIRAEIHDKGSPLKMANAVDNVRIRDIAGQPEVSRTNAHAGSCVSAPPIHENVGIFTANVRFLWTGQNLACFGCQRFRPAPDRGR